MGRLVPNDEDYDLADAKFDEQREERLIAHFNSVISIGYQVSTPHGKGEVVGYELLHRNGVTTSTTKPGPSVPYRYMIRLEPGHTWMADQPFYYAFDNEVTFLMGQF